MSTAATLTHQVAEQSESDRLRIERWVLAVAGATVFFTLYSFCNWVTSHRVDVGTLQFRWEQRIPFVPWMILPYLAEDLFFIVSFLVCASRVELWTHFKRIVAANVIAAICFLLFPLRMAAPHPRISGILTPFFSLLYALDRPYNLVPSLHIAQGLLIWVVLNRHVKAALRWPLVATFILIGISTLFTWQHGVADLAGGWMLGMLCWWMFPDPLNVDRQPLQRHWRGTVLWGGGALAMLALGYLLRPWGWLLAWPALGAALNSAAYAGAGTSIFRKSDGRLAVATQWLLLPILIGTRIARFFVADRREKWVVVMPNVVMGGRLSNRAARQLIAREGVTAVLDLTAECSECAVFRKLAYCNIAVLDMTAPTRQQFARAREFIRQNAVNGKVYVHCALGHTRAASVVVAQLLCEGHAVHVEGAIEQVRRCRPRMVLNHKVITALRDYRETLV